jgi:RNA polymerase sigma factor (sigma-70 family)
MGVLVAGEDAVVMVPLQNGAEFTDWVRPHLPAMAWLAARLAPMADRDDVVQDALARAWQKRSTFDPARGGARNWLLAITADQARKAWKRSSRHALTTDTDLVDFETRVEVERAVATLTRRQREVVGCVYFVGLSIADTAATLGISMGTVKSTLFDARARLRGLLEVTT